MSILCARDAGQSGYSEPQQAEAFALFQELGNPLTRYLLAMRVAPDRAQELVQDAFVELAQHLAAGRPKHNLRGWLFRVVNHLGLKEKRRAKSTRERIVPLSEEESALDWFADAAASPEGLLLLSERQRRLLGALSELSETERQCLHLRAEGLRYREIAAAAGLSTSGAAEALRRAVEALRKAVHE